MKKFSYLFVLCVFLRTTASAEVEQPSTSSDQTAQQAAQQTADQAGRNNFGAGGMGAASPYLSKDFIPTDQSIPNLGREYTLEAVTRDQRAAAAIQGTTGGLLLGAATGYFLAGNYIIGGILTGMAAQEFAEMANNNQAAQRNNNNRNVLTTTLGPANGTGSSSSSQGNPLPIYQPEIPKNFEDFLTKTGINVDDFKNSLLNGTMDSNLDSILSNLGQSANAYSMDDIEKAQAKAQQEYAKISNDVATNMAQDGSSGKGSLSRSPSSNSSAKEEATRKEDTQKSQSGEKVSASKSNVASNHPTTQDEKSQSFANELFALPAASSDQGLLFENYLKEQGLVPSRIGSNIFQVAHQNYRAFGKWRGKDGGKKNQIATRN